MALSTKAAIMLLCLSTSALAELTGTSDDVAAAVEVDEAANMKMQLLQKSSVKATQHKENSDDNAEEYIAEGDFVEEAKVQYSQRTWGQLVESSAEDGSVDQRRAALLAELQEIDAKLQGRTKDEAENDPQGAWGPQMDGYFVEEGHADTNVKCFSKEEAMNKCEEAPDCYAISTQSNVCGGQYRVTHGGPTMKHYAQWEAYNLHSFKLDRSKLPIKWSEHKCDNDKDKNIWNGYKVACGRAHFDEDMDACTKGHWGDDNGVSLCMKQKRGYSDDCSHCFGQLALCTAGPCMNECSSTTNVNSAQCDQCVEKECRPKFLLCLGDVQLKSHWLGTEVP